MYKVYCNDKPADETGFPELAGTGWTEEANTNASLSAAIEYMNLFLGPWRSKQSEDYKIGETVNYGLGESVYIKEV